MQILTRILIVNSSKKWPKSQNKGGPLWFCILTIFWTLFRSNFTIKFINISSKIIQNQTIQIHQNLLASLVNLIHFLRFILFDFSFHIAPVCSSRSKIDQKPGRPAWSNWPASPAANLLGRPWPHSCFCLKSNVKPIKSRSISFFWKALQRIPNNYEK